MYNSFWLFSLDLAQVIDNYFATFKMDDTAAVKAKLDRCKAVLRAHRGVTTKLTREIDELLALESLSEDHARLRVLYRQLETKSAVLAELDKEIFSCCELTDIEGEIEEAESTVAKIIEYKTKIESTQSPIRGHTSTYARIRISHRIFS